MSASGHGDGHGRDREIEVDGAEEDSRGRTALAKQSHERTEEDMHDGDSDDTNVVVPFSVEGCRVTKEARDRPQGIAANLSCTFRLVTSSERGGSVVARVRRERSTVLFGVLVVKMLVTRASRNTERGN